MEVTRVERRTGERRSGEVLRWDVKGRADGTEYLRRFERAGLAEAWKRRLEEGFAARLPFDLVTRQFLRPGVDSGRSAGRPGLPIAVSASAGAPRDGDPDGRRVPVPPAARGPAARPS